MKAFRITEDNATLPFALGKRIADALIQSQILIRSNEPCTFESTFFQVTLEVASECLVLLAAFRYKAVYDLTLPQKMPGFIISNGGNTQSLQDFAVTVDAVKKETGLNFFSLVPRQEQDRLESTITLDAWSW